MKDSRKVISYSVFNNASERVVIINGIHIHIKSVFIGQTTIDNAFVNIVKRRLSEEKNLYKAC